MIQTDKFRTKPVIDESALKNNQTSTATNTKSNSLKSMHSQQNFVLKKTGKDQGVQVDTKKIFDFDSEIKGVVSTITTKTIEQSLWEVEKEIELEKMKEKKVSYEKRQFDAKEKFKQFIDKEIDQSNAKYTLINKLTEDNKAIATKQLQNLYDNMNISTRLNDETPAERYLKAFRNKPSTEHQSYISGEYKDAVIRSAETSVGNSTEMSSKCGDILLNMKASVLASILDRAQAYIRLA
jgi:hypothetical protein